MNHPLSYDLARFEASVREARAADFDWRATYGAIGRKIPATDAAAVRLFSALTADIEAFVEAGKGSPYHNHLHTLDTMRAMLLLCEAADRIGLQCVMPAHILVLAMLGHDLRHPGGSSSPTRDHERVSADLVAGIARDCLMPLSQIEQIVDLILSTRPCFQIEMRAKSSGDLAHYLVGEADVMASLLPGVGSALSADLTREMGEAGEPVSVPFEVPQSRLAFLRAYRCISKPSRALGLDKAVATQISVLLERNPSLQNIEG